MRHIDLWAWTADPSDIPKRVWLVFTNRASDQSSAVFVTEAPPESWHQGASYEVFLHMSLTEDYSAVADNQQDAVSNPGGITPIRRAYGWHYGLMDGAPPGSRSRFPARLSPPPREPEDRRRDGTSPERGLHGDPVPTAAGARTTTTTSVAHALVVPLVYRREASHDHGPAGTPAKCRPSPGRRAGEMVTTMTTTTTPAKVGMLSRATLKHSDPKIKAKPCINYRIRSSA
jgi:hypothetical protein